jgi:hypothetical protein
MLNPDKQTVADLKALPKTKTTIAAMHGVSSSLSRGLDRFAHPRHTELVD